ncbi:MAG: gamma-glutamyltransferase, partial [Chloroflexaceae bacterium]|nr:gamma-glutamyltransferase [Chloroflexaceae bacterium]
METTFLTNPYTTRRTPVVAENGTVATSHPLAASAGLRMLLAGGNAIDAAVAMAITLTLVEPTSNGIGSDAFALVWDGNKLHGLNGSGRAPAALTLERVQERGGLHPFGWNTVTVPGAPALWQDLHERFGSLPFSQLVQPALEYAERGHPVASLIARNWTRGVEQAKARTGPQFEHFLPTFAPDGHAPTAGSRYVSQAHARTFRTLAEQGVQAFYRGEIAEAMVAFARETGGYLSMDDMANHTSTWVEPIATTYRGHEVWEIPPSGQGIAALIALGILEGLEIAHHPRDSVSAYHLQIEAMKLAFADVHRYVADPTFADVPIAGMLNPDYLARRRALIGPTARHPEPGAPPQGGTVYLCAADRDGLMVS